ncbi:MAG: type II secretion system protein GspM [Proteobacteria bacterium]|nr:type II secretion system protein GspM [Pseudomonadota bacterium]
MAISDRARDFWDRISPRERRLVVLLAIATPIIIAVWLGLAIHDGLVAMETRNDENRKALGIVEDLRARGPAQATDDVVATMGTDPLSLNTYLTNAAQKSGFTLKGTQPHTPVTKNKFVTNSVTCTVSELTLEQLTKFLHEIETGSKVVIVTSLDIRKNFKSKEKLDATLEVSTYSKEPPKEGDAPKDGDKDKDKSGSGSSSEKRV